MSTYFDGQHSFDRGNLCLIRSIVTQDSVSSESGVMLSVRVTKETRRVPVHAVLYTLYCTHCTVHIVHTRVTKETRRVPRG